jgi:hypothetical protein
MDLLRTKDLLSVLSPGSGDPISRWMLGVRPRGRAVGRWRETETALLPAPFWCTYAWNRPTSTGAGGRDPLWLGWRGKPWLTIRWRGYVASKWSQLERQLILGQRLSPIATSQHRPC